MTTVRNCVDRGIQLTFKSGNMKFSKNNLNPQKSLSNVYYQMSCLFLSGLPSCPPVPVLKPRCSIADCLPFYTAMLDMLLIGSQNRWHKRDPGRHMSKF